MKQQQLFVLIATIAVLTVVSAWTGPAAAGDRAAEAPATEAAAPAANPGDHLTSGQVAADVLATLDRDADPCQDFARYACGDWLDKTEIPADRSRWIRSFSEIRERNRETIKTLLEEAVRKPDNDADRKRIGDFYSSCMDEEAIEKAGVEPLGPTLAKIAAIDGPESLMKVLGELHRGGVRPMFGHQVLPDFKDPETNLWIVHQGGLGLPDRDYYVSDDETKKQLLVDYEAHVARMLSFLGDDAAAARDRAAEIVGLERRLAEVSRPRVELRNLEKLYNKIDLGGLRELSPSISWDAFLAGLGYPEIASINVATPEFFEALDELIKTTDLGVWRAYLRWHTINRAAPTLSAEIVEADFDFYNRKLRGQPEMEPRWQRCVEATEHGLGEAVGKLFVAERFAGSSKEVALEMIGDIFGAFEGALPSLAWMDETTRDRALDKMNAVGNKIGYPDEWRDYSSIEITRKSFFANSRAASEFEFDRRAREIGKAVDKNEWSMSPQAVNAYYNPVYNEIVFPAGILQPPFFHRDYPTAMNYGGIGGVIGHELSHGFDDSGRKFDPQGQLREWWEPEVSARFEERAQCVDDLYSGYEIEPGTAVNGRLTLGENIADLGGLKQAYRAYKRWEQRQEDGVSPAIEGLSGEQLFFIAWGQVWCGKVRPETARLLITTDTHSPPRFRINGPVSHHPAFAEAFSCEAGTPMNPKEKCEVW